jgi:hypothetical protein
MNQLSGNSLFPFLLIVFCDVTCSEFTHSFRAAPYECERFTLQKRPEKDLAVTTIAGILSLKLAISMRV